MAKSGSYIKLDRGLKKNSLWLERPFSKGQAWVDLLLLAQGVEMDKHYRGQIQHMEPGVVYTSILYLTNRWGWSRNKVYRFLNTLEKAEMIVLNQQKPSDTVGETIKRTRNGTYNGTTNGTIVSIVNWDVYQYCDTNNETENGTRNDTIKRTRNGTHNRKHIRESNKEKAIKNIPPKSPKGDSTPSENQGEVYEHEGKKYVRGTDLFRNKSHLLLKKDEGTVDDIPMVYRDGTYQAFDTFADYWRWRNQ